MTTDDDFMNVQPEKEANNDSSQQQAEAPIVFERPEMKDCIIREFHTIFRFKIYPNGQVWLEGKPISWFDKRGMIVKKKEPKSVVKAEQAQLQEEEAY